MIPYLRIHSHLAFGALLSLVLALVTSITLRSQEPPSKVDASLPKSVVEIAIYPSTLNEKPVEFKKMNRPEGDHEMALRNRAALKEAWRIQGLRNTDPVFNDMLMHRPKTGTFDAAQIAWIDYMHQKFERPLRDVLANAKKGVGISIDPEVDGDGDWDPKGYNGALCLAEPLLDWVFLEADQEGMDSILENVPIASAVIGDWLRTPDSLDIYCLKYESFLEGLASGKGVPNLALALKKMDSPLVSRSTFYRTYRSHLLFWGTVESEEIKNICNLDIVDSKVQPLVDKLVQQAYRKLVASGQYIADDDDSWHRVILKEKKSYIHLLTKLNYDPSQLERTDPMRLACIASITDYDRFVLWYESLYQEQVAKGIVEWKRARPENEQKTPYNLFPQWLNPIAASFLLTSRPFEYWINRQSIAASSLLFSIRDFVGQNDELPESLDRLPSGSLIVDPVTEQNFPYRRLTKKRAELDLMDFDTGIRKRYQLVLPGSGKD